MPQSNVHCCHMIICASCCIHFFPPYFCLPKTKKSYPGSPSNRWGLSARCDCPDVGWWREPDSQLSYTHITRGPTSHFSSSLPTNVATSARDKWARTWQTLRLAKNNMLSTDQLSRNANTKCALFCNYLHFDMSGRGDSFLYSPVNGCLRGSRRCGERFVAVLALGSTRT